VNPPVNPILRGAVRLLELYKRRLSPLLPPSCRFTPTCSEYARLALIRHGLGRGSVLTLLRVLRCQPLHPGGVDLP
jgi:putative membrane protein insertion efficiency factor